MTVQTNSAQNQIDYQSKALVPVSEHDLIHIPWAHNSTFFEPLCLNRHALTN